MATATPTRHTPEDLLEIDDRPMPELVGGQLIERGTGLEADAVAVTLCWLLWKYSRDGHPGLVNGSQCGYQIFPDDPEKVRVPSASYTQRERLPGGRASKGHARVAPDIVAEVLFPGTTLDDVRGKVSDFLGAGVPCVWVADPDSFTIHSFRADGTEARLGAGDFLDGGEALPGFRCPVAEVFDQLSLVADDGPQALPPGGDGYRGA